MNPTAPVAIGPSRPSFRRLALLVLLAIAASTGLPAPLHGEEVWAPGRWQWTFTMPDGTVTSPVLRIREENGVLSGSIRYRHASESPISELRLAGSRISFAIVRQGLDRRITTRYSGVIEGNRIQGTIESPWDGTPRSYAWEAKRLPETPEGGWKWITTVNDRRLEFTLTLKQEGDHLTGHLAGRKGQGVDIHHGRFRDGEVSFEVERERDGEKILSKFRGRLIRDRIQGREVATVGKTEHAYDWTAIRTD
jgi:hypothetical protein